MSETRDNGYYDVRGKLNWTHPVDVGHLILQLQTLDPTMKVSSVMGTPLDARRRARAHGLSMSYERWDPETGWLDYTREELPKCLAIWAYERKDYGELLSVSPEELAAQQATIAAQAGEIAQLRAACDERDLALDAIETQLDSIITARAQAGTETPQPDYRKFARRLLRAFPTQETESIQEIGLETGVLIEVEATEPCGESCVCAEFGFPTKCYRMAGTEGS